MGARRRRTIELKVGLWLAHVEANGTWSLKLTQVEHEEARRGPRHGEGGPLDDREEEELPRGDEVAEERRLRARKRLDRVELGPVGLSLAELVVDVLLDNVLDEVDGSRLLVLLEDGRHDAAVVTAVPLGFGHPDENEDDDESEKSGVQPPG